MRIFELVYWTLLVFHEYPLEIDQSQAAEDDKEEGDCHHLLWMGGHKFSIPKLSYMFRITLRIPQVIYEMLLLCRVTHQLRNQC